MILNIKQKYKNIFSAEFDVYDDNIVVANIQVQGASGSKECKCLINYKGRPIVLDNIKDMKINAKKRNRIYRITYDNKVVGHLYQTKQGLFSKKKSIQLSLPASLCDNYKILKEEKLINMIYQGSMQIGEFERSTTIIDMMYHYNLYAINEEYAVKSLLILLYNYIINGFNPGEKVANSYEKKEFKNNKKDLLKYNSEFKYQVK